jgi:aspartate carbamoyltransferase catalytic subunit
MNRLQEERFSYPQEFERLRHQFTLDASMLSRRSPLIMDPLPRIDEINTNVDSLPNAAYFRQAHFGVPVRMALLALLLQRT